MTPLLDPFSSRAAVDLLLTRAMPLLSAAELQSLSHATAAAEEQARWAADVSANVACLIASDEDIGSYHDRADVAGLLRHLGATFGHVAALALLGDRAARALAARAAGPEIADPKVADFYQRLERAAKRRARRARGKG